MSPSTPRCVFIGGGGHASVLLDALRSSGTATVIGALVRGGDDVHAGVDLPVLGTDDALERIAGDTATHFVVAVGGVGDNRPRRALFDRAVAAGLQPLTVRHSSSIVSSRASIGAGCQLLPGSIVNAGAMLGANVVVNSGAIVEHDCRIADHVHIATGARLASTVSVGLGAHIGAGATVIQCRSIGEWAVVGAGAVVVDDVPPHAVVVGVPARTRESRS